MLPSLAAHPAVLPPTGCPAAVIPSLLRCVTHGRAAGPCDDRQVLIRVQATAINRADTLQRKGGVSRAPTPPSPGGERRVARLPAGDSGDDMVLTTPFRQRTTPRLAAAPSLAWRPRG